MEERGRLEKKIGREEGEGKEGKKREIEGGRGGNREGKKGEIISMATVS